MILEQFKEKNEKKTIIIIFSVVIVLLITGLFLYQSFAFFESQKNYDVIKGIVSYSPSDITIVSYLDGTISKTFPSKDDKYAVDSVECNNEAIGTWNYTNWEVNIQNLTNTKTKCKVYFVTRYKENVLNGTDPIISENLIPVTITNDGTVKKADMKREWYNYSNKQWANAVILEDETSNYQNGEVIPESNIESYFVWIPRYKYKIFNEGNYSSLINTNYQNKAQTIEVIFENKNTSVSTGNTVGSYLTHPAFTSFNSNGMWVGKFETGYKGAINLTSAQQNTFEPDKIIIKPNTYSWRSIQVSNAHLNSYNYKRELDSHLIKNTEWGAIAFLSHSNYGVTEDIKINNNYNFLTGFGAVYDQTLGFLTSSAPSCKESPTSCRESGDNREINDYYNTVVGQEASNVKNITGIYDMSGGAWEYTMAIMKNENGVPIVGRNSSNMSNFSGLLADGSILGEIDLPDNKYVDYYNYSNSEMNFISGILGDATKELGPFYQPISSMTERYLNSWYFDEAKFMTLSNPFLLRSGDIGHGNGSGIFTFSSDRGTAMTWAGYRIVLTP